MKRYGLVSHARCDWRGGTIVPGRMACEWEDLPVVSQLTCHYSHRC